MTPESNPLVKLAVDLCGIIYFSAWSFSFYPQVILNYQRKSTSGVSPDFLYINPIGFLALSLWNWGVYFIPTIREQYKTRHQNHEPQIAISDLAFSAHAFILSVITLGQVFWYRRRSRLASTNQASSDEQARLIQPIEDTTTDLVKGSSSIIPNAPDKPSRLCQLSILGILILSFSSAISVRIGKTEALDWLYLMSSIKLFISIVKYVPQIILNYRLKSVVGFAVSAIFCDMIGSIFSFIQLVVSSTLIEHDPSGIIANPAKLGLAAMSFAFDGTFIVQKFLLYPEARDEPVGEEDREEDSTEA